MKNEYLKRDGNNCPHCKSDDMDTHKFQTDGLSACRTITCSECGEEWSDIYRLVDIEEI